MRRNQNGTLRVGKRPGKKRSIHISFDKNLPVKAVKVKMKGK